MRGSNNHFETRHAARRGNGCNTNSDIGRAVFGVLVLLGGLALLLRSLDIYRGFIDAYIFEWQIILIVFGIISVITHSNKGPGIIMLAIGAVFYLRDYYNFTLNIVFWQVLVAIVLVLVGISILFMKKNRGTNNSTDPETDSENSNNPEFIEDVAILGGTERSVITDNFKGGRIIAIFGGSSFNLKGSSLGAGKNYLDVLCIFGGFKLYIPENWNIKIQTVSIFGGMSDKSKPFDTAGNVIHANEIVIKGLVLFGGGEIKR